MSEMWLLLWLQLISLDNCRTHFFTAAIPSEFGMLVYNDLTSIVTI